LALVLLLPYACAPIYRFAPPRPFSGARFYNPYSQSFPWRRANLHAHGRAWLGVTSAAQGDADVASAYRNRGYDVAAISDYQRIAAAQPGELPVYEHGFNIGKHHQLAIGARSVVWFDLPLWQGINQKQYVISQVAGAADLVAIAHPAALQGYAYSDEELAQLSGYQLMEVVNGRFMTESSWDAALSAGRAVWSIGDDDTHDVKKPDRFTVAWNMIAAPSTSPAAIVDALRAGRTYTILQLPDADGQETTLSAVSVDEGVVTIALAGRPADISFVGQNGVVRKTVEDVSTASYPFTLNDTYIRAVVRTPARMLFVNPIVRFDGVAVPVPAATINAPMTWLQRAAILAVAALLVWGTVRRHRMPAARDESKAGRPWRRVAGFMVLAVAAFTRPAHAQEPPKPPTPGPVSTVDQAPLTSTFPAGLLSVLPTGDSLFSLIEAAHAETTSDRISAGGIGFGTAARLSAFGSSATQTRYRIGDVDITDPSGGGTPMAIPELSFWQRVSVGSGVGSGLSRTPQTGVDFVTPGVGIALEPRRPTAQWATSFEASSSFGDSLTANPATVAPPIGRLAGWNRGSLLASGPIVPERLGLVFSGSFTHAAQSNRGTALSLDSDVASAFANLVFTPSPTDEVQTVGWIQRATFPPANSAVFASAQSTMNDASLHVQSTWAHTNPDARFPTPEAWRAFAGYTQRDRTPPALATTATIERLYDGPPPFQSVDTGTVTERRFTIGGRGSQRRGSHAFEFGADLDFAHASSDPGFNGSIGEFVDGAPSRIWTYTTPAVTSRRHSTTIAGFVNDHFAVSDHSALDVAIRFEHVGAAADGAVQGISWWTPLPRAMFRSALSDAHHIDWFVGGGRSAYQLPLDLLAWGDPAAPSVDVFRWLGGSLAPTGPRLLNVGPGATGRIDPNLTRPYSDDLTFGIQARPRPGVTIELAGLCRWERQLFGVVNVSPNGPRYTILNVDDPGLDLGSTSDDQVLPVSNLALPSTTYQFDNVLTNPSDATARRLGAKLTAEYSSDRLFLLFGATAYAAEGVASSRGAKVTENDQGLVGEDPLNPNAVIYDRGRLFGDRAFTGKLSAVYRFPSDVTVGAIARYQDGQPFARLVVVPDLNQGPDIVRAFANGGSRFTFTATLDLRVQKEFVVDGRRVGAFVDAFNLTNRADEVEERAVTGTMFRAPTAVQPPRTIHFGARVSF
jgi:hypothetical protein